MSTVSPIRSLLTLAYWKKLGSIRYAGTYANKKVPETDFQKGSGSTARSQLRSRYGMNRDTVIQTPFLDLFHVLEELG